VAPGTPWEIFTTVDQSTDSLPEIEGIGSIPIQPWDPMAKHIDPLHMERDENFMDAPE
jgi:hypothetical protein